MAPLKVWLSWSSGKDSAYTLHKLRQEPEKYDVIGLLTTLNGVANRVAMHAVRSELLVLQAQATGLPVHQVMLPFPCTNEDYAERMIAAIKVAVAAGVEAMAFGDLFLADVRAYREKNMEGTGLSTVFPLWGTPTAQLAQEMVAAGLRSILTCIDPKKLDRSFAGRTFDQQLLQDLPADVDPCGENGEFHTFVYQGPMLQHPLEVEIGEVVERDGFVFCDVLPAGAKADGEQQGGGGGQKDAVAKEPTAVSTSSSKAAVEC